VVGDAHEAVLLIVFVSCFLEDWTEAIVIDVGLANKDDVAVGVVGVDSLVAYGICLTGKPARGIPLVACDVAIVVDDADNLSA
jgi:hypothetical protein